MSALYAIIDADQFAMDSMRALPVFSMFEARNVVIVPRFGDPDPMEIEGESDWNDALTASGNPGWRAQRLNRAMFEATTS